MDYILIRLRSTDYGLRTTVNDIKELLKDWIRLYPNSFASDVDFKIYKLDNEDIIIRLHEDLSSMAVSLLILYLKSTINAQQSENLVSAYITIDDTEILLKQNLGKRAKLFFESPSLQVTESPSQSSVSESASESVSVSVSKVRFLLEDNYALDYDFERKPQPVKNSGLHFEEAELILPEEYESVIVGDVVKKEIDKVLEEDGLTPKKMMWYLICGALGLAIGFLIVYLTEK